MRSLILALALILGTGASVSAQSSEIEATISNQITAFKADDFAQAFTFASPTIQQLFQTPENFGRMVSQGYPMVWRPADVRYLELREISGELWQKVMITDADGAVHVLDYRMQKSESGWKINGVQILAQPEANV